MIQKFQVVDLERPQRLDKYLSQKKEIFFSRTQAQNAIEANKVLINEKTGKSSSLVNPGDWIEVRDLESFSLDERVNFSSPLPLKLDLDILFEDEDVIVLDKPSGLVVHPAAGHQQDTLVNALVHRLGPFNYQPSEQFPRPGIVHRLDKDTSGVMVIAKTSSSHVHLSKQFSERSIHRNYLALVHGKLSKSSGNIQTYLARHPKDRKKYASLRDSQRKIIDGKNPRNEVEKGKWASTYWILEPAQDRVPPNTSFLRLKLETGRTHQIRVHMSEMGHPIVGDSIYGNLVKDKKIPSVTRLALHAHSLEFFHPRTQERMKFSSPWPL